ncbi:hypothetical protein LTR37_012155 [Vermiconidia calcicola]|uniref:Uncharacterized protein n=1 Tax=Vermiconidia calcicola TaxID=1690605 RepID=A0ACC3MZZ7_9PEZI|nr:hypothetical protein LTR37_012155 [Vermiconidia calcicola]
MISARKRLVQLSAGMPINVRGVTVEQDEYVIADRCGTVFVPAQHIQEVLELAESINHRQEGMVQAVQGGRPVSEFMHDTQFEAIHTTSATPTTPLKAAGFKQNPRAASPEDRELTALFANLNTPGVFDALDKLEIPGQAFNIMPLANYRKTTVGPAFTVRYESAKDPPGSVGDFIDDVAGDTMTQYAGIRGLAGTVIDGVCRDVDRALTDEYPLSTAGRWMRTGKDRVEAAGVNETVSIGKARVEPRDIVVADANGVLVFPKQRAREVAEVARKIEENESNIRELLTSGSTIAEARAELGYHTLQRKR